MGSYARYYGNQKIPEPLQEEFNERMLKILNYGGMMQLEKVMMFDLKLILLEPLKLSLTDEVSFHFNYFEDDFWESAGYDAREHDLWSNKVGSCEFCDVILAAYMLYEIYSDEIGFALYNGEMIEADKIIGWFNQLFGSEYSLSKRFRLWDSLETYAYRYEEYNNKATKNEFKSLLSNKMLKYAGGIELADVCYVLNGTATITEKSASPGTYPAELLCCRNKLTTYIQDAVDKEIAFQRIWELLSKNREQRSDESGDLADISKLSLILPARMIAFLTTEILGKNFWKEWKLIKEKIYHDEEIKSYAAPEIVVFRRRGRNQPVPKVRTSDFLYQNNYFTFDNTPEELNNEPCYFVSDADRLFWWDGTDEVIIDEKTDKWLEELAKRHKELIGKADENNKWGTENFLPNFLKLLRDIDDFYERIMPFKSMFYEFIGHSQQPEYKAAVLLLQELSEEWKYSGKAIKHRHGSWELCSRKVTFNSGRLHLKRYLSVMANLKLRKKYFDF